MPIDKLKSGKASGNDVLSAEYVMASDSRITILLSLFYNRGISHGLLPDDFLIIVPTIPNMSYIHHLLSLCLHDTVILTHIWVV